MNPAKTRPKTNNSAASLPRCLLISTLAVEMSLSGGCTRREPPSEEFLIQSTETFSFSLGRQEKSNRKWEKCSESFSVFIGNAIEVRAGESSCHES